MSRNWRNDRPSIDEKKLPAGFMKKNLNARDMDALDDDTQSSRIAGKPKVVVPLDIPRPPSNNVQNVTNNAPVSSTTQINHPTFGATRSVDNRSTISHRSNSRDDNSRRNAVSRSSKPDNQRNSFCDIDQKGSIKLPLEMPSNGGFIPGLDLVPLAEADEVDVGYSRQVDENSADRHHRPFVVPMDDDVDIYGPEKYEINKLTLPNTASVINFSNNAPKSSVADPRLHKSSVKHDGLLTGTALSSKSTKGGHYPNLESSAVSRPHHSSGRSQKEPPATIPPSNSGTSRHVNSNNPKTVPPAEEKVEPEAEASEEIRPVVNSKERENVEYKIHDFERKLIKWKRELDELAHKEVELMRQRQRTKDGQVEIDLEDNREVQQRLKREISETENWLEVFRRKLDAYMKSVASRPPPKPVEQQRTAPKPQQSVPHKRSSQPVIRQAVPPPSQYRYVDLGNHWCKICGDVFTNVGVYLKHLHQAHGRSVEQSLAPSERPWAVPPIDTKRASKLQALPFRGVEFLMATSGFYCNLCKEMYGDDTAARIHLESELHNIKYRTFVREDPQYEKKFDAERNASVQQKQDLIERSVRETMSNAFTDNVQPSTSSYERNSTPELANGLEAVDKAPVQTPSTFISTQDVPETEVDERPTRPTATKITGILKGVSKPIIKTEPRPPEISAKNFEISSEEARENAIRLLERLNESVSKPPSPLPPPETGSSSVPASETVAVPVRIKSEPADKGYEKYMVSNGNGNRYTESPSPPPSPPTSEPVPEIPFVYFKKEVDGNESERNEPEAVPAEVPVEGVKMEVDNDEGSLNLRITSVTSMNSVSWGESDMDSNVEAARPQDGDNDDETIPDTT